MDAGTSRQNSKTVATVWSYYEIPGVAVVGIGKEGGGTIILCATCRVEGRLGLNFRFGKGVHPRMCTSSQPQPKQSRSQLTPVNWDVSRKNS